MLFIVTEGRRWFVQSIPLHSQIPYITPPLPLLLLPLPSSTTLYHQPSKQGLGSYCPLLMLSNLVLFRCCRTVWLSKFVIVQNSYLCLGSDCHCSSLFHTSFCSSLLHTSLCLGSDCHCPSLFHTSFCSSLLHTSFCLNPGPIFSEN